MTWWWNTGSKNGSLAITSDERFGYDGWDTPSRADLSSANAVTMRRVYGAGFDQPLVRVSSTGVVGWYLTDRQGSVRQVLDNSGTTIGSRDYSVRDGEGTTIGIPTRGEHQGGEKVHLRIQARVDHPR